MPPLTTAMKAGALGKVNVGLRLAESTLRSPSLKGLTQAVRLRRFVLLASLSLASAMQEQKQHDLPLNELWLEFIQPDDVLFNNDTKQWVRVHGLFAGNDASGKDNFYKLEVIQEDQVLNDLIPFNHRTEPDTLKVTKAMFNVTDYVFKGRTVRGKLENQPTQQHHVRHVEAVESKHFAETPIADPRAPPSPSDFLIRGNVLQRNDEEFPNAWIVDGNLQTKGSSFLPIRPIKLLRQDFKKSDPDGSNKGLFRCENRESRHKPRRSPLTLERHYKMLGSLNGENWTNSGLGSSHYFVTPVPLRVYQWLCTPATETR